MNFMLNFIIYEDSKKMRDLYEKVIDQFIGNKQEEYHIIQIHEFNPVSQKRLEKLEGRKIYILDLKVPGKSGYDFAREIRNSGDWKSQIIIISAFEHLKNHIFMGKMLTLDFISKKENIATRLEETLEVAYNISTSHRFFSFRSGGELFHLPYHDILYFEKDLNDNYTSIITYQNTYKIKKSILQIERILENDLRFLKTHQSCIVNLYNIKSVNLSKKIINFGEKQTCLLSREHKKELKERLICN